MDIIASKNNYQQSPRKIRPILYLLKGKKSDKAISMLESTTNKSSYMLKNLIKSAVASAKEKNLDEDNLIIKNIICNEASRIKRHRFGAKGRTYKFKKRKSHIVVTLENQTAEKDNDIKKKNKKEKKDGTKS